MIVAPRYQREDRGGHHRIRGRLPTDDLPHLGPTRLPSAPHHAGDTRAGGSAVSAAEGGKGDGQRKRRKR